MLAKYVNESININFLDSLSREDFKEINDIIRDWMYDTTDFQRSRITLVYDKLKNSKYISNNKNIYRVLYLKNIHEYLNDDNSLNKEKLRSNIKLDKSTYYSYTNSIADLIYVIWRWTDNDTYMNSKSSKYGIIIKQKSKDAINITDFNVDTHKYMDNKYHYDDSLLHDYRSADLQHEEGESEVISKMDDFVIDGVIEYDPNNLHDHSNATLIDSSDMYDDYENEANLYYYKINKFKIKNI